MTEPPTTTTSRVRPPEHDALLATKLHIPRPRPNVLARPRLLERLTQGAVRELTLVCAPAGFGKTSLLGDWAWPRLARARSPSQSRICSRSTCSRHPYL